MNRDVQEECANGLYRVYTCNSNTDDENNAFFTVNNLSLVNDYETEFVLRSLMA